MSLQTSIPNTLQMDNSAGVRDADPLVRARAEGEYHLEYHDEEVARLAAQHEVFLDAMGKLVFAPVDLGRNGLRILDSGTADGMPTPTMEAIIPQPVLNSY